MVMAGWSDEMMRHWSDAQKRYWDAWTEMARMGQTPADSGQAQATQPPWSEGLEQWWKAISPHTVPGPATDAFKRMVDMGRQYMSLAETAFRVQQVGINGQDAMDAWLNALEAGFRQSANQLETGKYAAHALGMNQAAWDNWQRVLKSLGMDVIQQVGAGGFQMPTSENWQEHFGRMLAAPAIGYNREVQERLQALVKLAIDYQEALDDYLKAFARQGLGAVAALRERVQQLRSEGKVLHSVRELYDLWVEVNEADYARFAMTDEYQVVYGDMVNALMALKQGIQAELDSIYHTVNLPTRRELDAAYQHLHGLRRDNRALRQQLRELGRRMAVLEAAVPSELPKPAVLQLESVAVQQPLPEMPEALLQPESIAVQQPLPEMPVPADTAVESAVVPQPADPQPTRKPLAAAPRRSRGNKPAPSA